MIESINHSPEISLLEVAKGMMQFSSNACTDFLINKIGIDVINESIEELQLNHDKITYLTSPLLIPAYLSDKAAPAKLDKESYRKLSKELFEQMKLGECEELKEKALKMVNTKTQLLFTKNLPTSTRKQYADLMNELRISFTEKEKELFSHIVIGVNLKQSGHNFFGIKVDQLYLF